MNKRFMSLLIIGSFIIGLMLVTSFSSVLNVCAANSLCPTPTDTDIPPTDTEVPPTPTDTEVPPTFTSTPTDTEIPPTSTHTPTSTYTPTPTNTDVPPTVTKEPPTPTVTNELPTYTPTGTLIPPTPTTELVTETPMLTVTPTDLVTSTPTGTKVPPTSTPTSTDIPLITPTKTSIPDKATETPFPPYAGVSNDVINYPGVQLGKIVIDGLAFDLYEGVNASDGSLMLPSFNEGAAIYQNAVWVHRMWKFGWISLQVGSVVIINGDTYKVTSMHNIAYGVYPKVTNSGFQYIASCYSDDAGNWVGVRLYEIELIRNHRR